MKNIIILLAFALSSTILFAAKPIVEVPSVPPNSELEIYEESEEIFALKVLELYKLSVALETQLKLYGITPSTRLTQPTMEELEDMDMKIIKKYYSIANSLYKEVLQAPESDRQELLNEINDLNWRLRDTIAVYTIEQGKIKNALLDLMNSRLKFLEQTNTQNLELAINQNFVNCVDYHTWFSVAGISKLFISSGKDVVTNDPGLGVQATVNLSKLTGFWNGLQVKYEYFAPKFYTEYKFEGIPTFREQWNSNINNVSIGGPVLISKSPEFINGLELFAGYFWANGNIYNSSGGNMNWDGTSLNLDYFMGVPSCKYPVELFFGLNVYHSFSKDLIFDTHVAQYERNELGKTHLGVNVGLRYNIWRSPF